MLTATIRAGLPAVDPAELFELVGLLGRDDEGLDVGPAPVVAPLLDALLELGVPVLVLAAVAPLLGGFNAPIAPNPIRAITAPPPHAVFFFTRTPPAVSVVVVPGIPRQGPSSPGQNRVVHWPQRADCTR